MHPPARAPVQLMLHTARPLRNARLPLLLWFANHLPVVMGLRPVEMNKLKTTTTARMNKKVKVIFDRGHGHGSSAMWTFLASQDRCQCGGMCSCHIGFYTLRLVTTFGSSTTHIISGLLNRSGTGRCQFIRLLLFEMSLFFLW